MNLLKTFGLLGALALSMGAGATTWNTSLAVGSTAGSIYCGKNASNQDVCQSGSSAGLNNFITLSAYATTVHGTATAGQADTSAWVAANIQIFAGGGIGIINNQGGTEQQGACTGTGCAGAIEGAPQHAIDNRGVDDVLVVNFGSSNWDVSSFTLGYICNIAQTINGDCTGTNGNAVDADAWLVTSAAGVGSAFSATNTLQGRAPLVLNPDGTSTTLTRGESGSSTGQYLVITAALAGFSDSFKISSITATQTPNTPKAAPVPGTVPLLALGLLALMLSNRRFATIRR